MFGDVAFSRRGPHARSRKVIVMHRKNQPEFGSPRTQIPSACQSTRTFQADVERSRYVPNPFYQANPSRNCLHLRPGHHVGRFIIILAEASEHGMILMNPDACCF